MTDCYRSPKKCWRCSLCCDEPIGPGYGGYYGTDWLPGVHLPFAQGPVSDLSPFYFVDHATMERAVLTASLRSLEKGAELERRADEPCGGSTWTKGEGGATEDG